jgi:hypothetical protein
MPLTSEVKLAPFMCSYGAVVAPSNPSPMSNLLGWMLLALGLPICKKE